MATLSPTTKRGRIFFVLYATFGIPLCLIFLAGLGDRLTKAKENLEKRLDRNYCPQKPTMDKACRTILIVVLGLVSFIFLPSVFFVRREGWSYNDSLYYAFVTLTTIGFGDFVPAQHEDVRWLYKLLLGVWVFVGLAWLATVISLLRDFFNNCLQKASGERKNTQDNHEKNVTDNIKQSLPNLQSAVGPGSLTKC
ncbi:hypothetical protein CAPTEDRAFT_204871 [Capitella teleta]|uniref:Potassium channel domain-containing protein n=1 Tax=Capitella teleta TaxID=283909 RepID=R7TR25_CAPTE|nr:hypothetical protein CAPTEDRAFT_204871 [Capitella teleta]|eukprot:ELT93490.1 hypothetical protein CAPTEDRAFT_204871 [Capitella teleta]